MSTAVAFAHTALVHACAFAENAANPRLRQQAESERLRGELASRHEELALLRSRFARLDPRKRPHYTPAERMRILLLKAARGWSQAQAAAALLVEPLTIHLWEKKLREDGESEFLDVGAPVNRFPDCVGLLVTRLKTLCPAFGKVKIAQVLARAGLHPAASTARRKYDEDDGSTPDPKEESVREESGRVVTARYPNHVWHADLTVMPTRSGFWVPWSPLACLQCWPFAWWLVIVVDHYSRRVMKAGVFKKQPSSEEVCAVLDEARKWRGGIRAT